MFDDTETDVNEIELDVSVLDLLDFGGPNLMKQGDEVYKAGHLIHVGVTSVATASCKIEGICLQTSDPDGPPHTIEIDTADAFTNWKFICSCKAGLGSRCKHIYAVLLHIHGQKNLEITTCTQQPQKWGKISKESGKKILEPEQIKKLPEFCGSIQNQYEATAEELAYFKETLLSDPTSAIAIFLERCELNEDIGEKDNDDESIDYDDATIFIRSLLKFNFKLRAHVFRTISQWLLTFYNQRICLTEKQSVQLHINTRQQNNLSWEHERKFRVTSSNCYMLYTGYNNGADLRARVATYYKAVSNSNVKIGLREEPKARALYENEKKVVVHKFGLLVHPSCPWAGCSIDGFCVETKILIEIKTLMNEKNETFDNALKNCQYVEAKGEQFFLRKKHRYYAQVQMSMYLFQCKMCHFIVYNYKANEIKTFEVPFDETFAKDLMKILKKVYFSYMLPYIFEHFLTENDQLQYGKTSNPSEAILLESST